MLIIDIDLVDIITFSITIMFNVTHHLDASSGFLEDSVLKHDHEVMARSADIHATEIGGPITLVVLNHTCSTMNYRSAKSTISVHKFILMDGSGGVFRAQLKTSLSKATRSWAVAYGCSVMVKNWNWIWCNSLTDIPCRAVHRDILLINDYSWNPVPSPNPCDGASDGLSYLIGDETSTKIMDAAVVDYTEETSFVGWLEHITNENDEVIYILMTQEDIELGLFINRVQARKDFVEKVKCERAYDYFDYHLSSDDDDESKEPGHCKCRACCGIDYVLCCNSVSGREDSHGSPDDI